MKIKIIFLGLFCSVILYAEFAYEIKINGGINPASENYIAGSIKKAHQDGANFLLIELNTPGGLLSSTRNIVQAIFKAEIPVVVYIAPSGAQAGSAGVMVTLASHIAVMAPATNIGAAHPVQASGKDLAKKMNEKIENDTVAFVKSIAELRKRNIKWAELAVSKSSSITAKEAVSKKVIDMIAADTDELLKNLDGKKIDIKGDGKKYFTINTKDIELRLLDMNLMQKTIMLISQPNIAYLLMMAGMLGLYVEFTHPGLIFPGVAGALSLVLAFISMQTLPINIGALLLIILGIAFLIAEIFVTSFGVLSIGGILSLFIGSIFLIDSSFTSASISYAVILPAIVVLAAFVLFVGFVLLKSRWLPHATGRSSIVGKEVEVVEALKPLGKVFFDAALWNAEAEGGVSIDRGERVEITRVDGLKVFVKKLGKQS